MTGMVLGGRYRLEASLGSGGMAEVWRAVDERLGRKVAVKLLHPRALPPERERFLLEVRALSRLFHPGIVQVLDLGEMEGRPYFVMELVEGAPLTAWAPLRRDQRGKGSSRRPSRLWKPWPTFTPRASSTGTSPPKTSSSPRRGIPR